MDSSVHCAIVNISWKFHQNLLISFWVILQTNRETTPSLIQSLLDGGNYTITQDYYNYSGLYLAQYVASVNSNGNDKSKRRKWCSKTSIYFILKQYLHKTSIWKLLTFGFEIKLSKPELSIFVIRLPLHTFKELFSDNLCKNYFTLGLPQ